MRPSLRRGRGPAAPRSGEDDDTGPGYYDTPPATSGARAEPGSRPGAGPCTRAPVAMVHLSWCPMVV